MCSVNKCAKLTKILVIKIVESWSRSVDLEIWVLPKGRKLSRETRVKVTKNTTLTKVISGPMFTNVLILGIF